MQITYLVRSLIQVLRKAIFRGDQYYCPLCRASYSKFLSMGTPPKPNARCPGCGSLERHRLLWVGMDYLQTQGVLGKGGRLLHMAPEGCLMKELRKNYEYVSVDMYASEVQAKADITALCFSDKYFDAIICNHVLEHVPDDRKAISELYRVLKHGGWGSIQVPIKAERTLEDTSVTDPVERERLYGQSDHVRQYGEDFRGRLQEAGFDVLELKKEKLLDPVALERLSVACEKSVMLVRKFPAQAKQCCPV